MGTQPPKPSEGQRGHVESDCLSTKADLFIHDKWDQGSYTHWFKRYQRDRAPINQTHAANSMLTTQPGRLFIGYNMLYETQPGRLLGTQSQCFRQHCITWNYVAWCKHSKGRFNAGNNWSRNPLVAKQNNKQRSVKKVIYPIANI